jgi:peptidase A4-like protein
VDRRSSRRPVGRIARAGALACAVALLGAGCDSPVSPTPSAAAPTETPSSQPTARPTPSPTPTPTPTPSLTPSAAPTASPTIAPPALVDPCPGSAPPAQAGRASTGRSRNWAGYVATGATTFACVEATWTQPKVRCVGSAAQSVVFWVGLGGFDQRGLVQVGTESTCGPAGTLVAAWHESLPKERFSIRSAIRVSAGDRVWAQARWLDGSHYRLSLADLTNRQHFTLRVTNAVVDRTSAEWIVEAPTGGCPSHCHTLRMPDFRTFRFSEAWLSLGGVRRPVNGTRFVHVREAMVNSAGATRAAVTSLGSTGASFTVRWRRP